MLALLTSRQLTQAGCALIGTEKLIGVWVPRVLEAQHSFFSCLCLGASHLDIMAGLIRESETTITLKMVVIQEINENLVGPVSEISDLTVMAILQVIASETINGDVLALEYHIEGLTTIIEQRGGLQMLRLQGLIAGVLPT